MAEYEPIEARAFFRSHSHLPIWEILEEAGIWRQVGMRVKFEFCGSSTVAEKALFNGSVAFVSGNHITPYALVARGEPIVCLASPSNSVRNRLVSRQPIASLSDLKGRRIGETTLVDPTGGYHHLRGNHMLEVLRAGLALDQVEWVEIAETMEDFRRMQMGALQSGKVDATFLTGSAEEYKKAGYHILNLEPLPMVTGPTLTTTIGALDTKGRLGERLVKAMVLGIHFVRAHRQETEAILTGLRKRIPEVGNAGYDSVAKFEPKPYPTPQAVMNAYELCLMKAPETREVSPLALWDLHYLRGLDASGFISRLYQNG
ncbi:MAG: ABC transporter substrate-binding protein [Deltaproteobacteria bacterium]|nr:ABC transporter substrate-binding protein [Deltaproteobacteria bacterium]